MKDSKLIEIVTSFSKDEMRSFEKFVDSPYFERERDVRGLFSLLKKYYPDFDSEKMERVNIFELLFPGESYNEKKLKNITFDLAKLAEQFMVFNSFRKDELESKLLIAEELKERDLDNLFLSTMKLIEKKLDKTVFDSSICFEQKEKFMLMKDDFYFWKNDFDSSIEFRLKYNEYFTLSFLIRFLHYLRDKRTITVRHNKEFKNTLLDSVYENLDFEKLLKSLQRKKYSFLWLIELYYRFYMCSSDVDDRIHYDKLKKIFFDNMEFFSRSEKDQIFSVLIAYCEGRGEKGDSDIFKEEFTLIKKMIQLNIFTPENKYINVLIFRNIMLLALKLKEYNWLEEFARTHIDRLKPDLRENMDFLVKANLHFARGSFDQALDCLNKIKYDIFIYKFDVKNLMLKIYYELDLFENAASLIDAYKHFLASNKNHSDIHRKQYGNFINIYSKLIKAKENGKNGEMDFLMNEINSTEALASRLWLKEKITQLAKN